MSGVTCNPQAVATAANPTPPASPRQRSCSRLYGKSDNLLANKGCICRHGQYQPAFNANIVGPSSDDSTHPSSEGTYPSTVGGTSTLDNGGEDNIRYSRAGCSSPGRRSCKRQTGTAAEIRSSRHRRALVVGCPG
jgi:hypothetical protein